MEVIRETEKKIRKTELTTSTEKVKKAELDGPDGPHHLKRSAVMFSDFFPLEGLLQHRQQ